MRAHTQQTLLRIIETPHMHLKKCKRKRTRARTQTYTLVHARRGTQTRTYTRAHVYKHINPTHSHPGLRLLVLKPAIIPPVILANSLPRPDTHQENSNNIPK